jgi:hypothetical protein
MYVDFNHRSLAQQAADFLTLANGQTQVWPAAQPIQAIADPRFQGTRFQDNALIVGEWLPRVLEQGARQPANVHGWGGKKIRDEETWAFASARLLCLRALMMFCRATGATSAHIVDRWANIMEHTDYSRPHCHYESQGAVVYSLEPGDKISHLMGDGCFELIDSRVPFCCPSRPERPTRGIMPDMQPGTMVCFPAEWLHYVKPYTGRRPRVTVAWNISAGPPPEKPIDFTQQVAGAIGKVS